MKFYQGKILVYLVKVVLYMFTVWRAVNNTI